MPSASFASCVQSIRCRLLCGLQFRLGPLAIDANRRSSIVRRTFRPPATVPSGVLGSGVLMHPSYFGAGASVPAFAPGPLFSAVWSSPSPLTVTTPSAYCSASSPVIL